MTSLLGGLGGAAVSSQGVLVLAVPADEGYWVGNSHADRIWVQLVGAGESRGSVHTGDRVSFSGLVRSHGDAFPSRVGVSRAEGARQLTRQGRHIAADQDTLIAQN